MSERRFVFSLTDAQASALIEFGGVLEPYVKRNSPLDRATAEMDEQYASQSRKWERCKNCNGSGWVEDE